MTTATRKVPPGWPKRIAGFAGGGVVAVGLLVLVGWIVDAPFLRGPFLGREMPADTAVAFLVSGAALLLTISEPSPRKRRGARLLAGLAIVFGAFTLVEHLLGHKLGLGELFPHASAINTAEPGAIAPKGAIEFVCLGIALLLLNTPHGAENRLVAMLAGTSFAIVMFAIVGYTFGAAGIDGVTGTTTVVLSTAITFLLLSAGIVAAAPNCIFGEVQTSGGPGGVVLRRLLPTSVVAFPAFGWLVLEGERHRLYSLASGLAWFVLVSTVVLALAVLSLAKRLNSVDVERRHAATRATRLAALVDASSEAIMSSDAHGSITTCNRAAEELYGYTEAELTGRPVAILSPPNKRLEQQRLMAAAARGAATIECDTQRVHKNGSVLDVSVTLSRITESGSFRGYCAVTHDISRRVREHDELEANIRDRTHELFRSRAEMLHSLALAAEYRDYDTAEHTERVGENAALLAERLGLSVSFVALIRQAAPLHDLGKIGIPDQILLKSAALTPEEFDVMKEHTILGSRLLARSDSEVLQLGETIALAHHERWDGKGYPAGLAGEAIPIAALIVAVVDAFDAMTHDRPYRAARSIAEAVVEISGCSGTQFDPGVVEAFLNSPIASTATTARTDGLRRSRRLTRGSSAPATV
jgi:PAS domain S-box-containing protein